MLPGSSQEIFFRELDHLVAQLLEKVLRQAVVLQADQPADDR